MPLDSKRRRPEGAEKRQSSGDENTDDLYTLESGARRHDILCGVPAQRIVEHITRAGLRYGQAGPRERTGPSTLRSRSSEGRADMQREDDLEDRERDEQEKRSDECELHDGAPAVLPDAGE